MSYKVAVASSDDKFINQHFGRTRRFLIFEMKEGGEFEFLASRENNPPCGAGEHDDHLLEKTVDLVADCKIVFASQIGPGAEDILLARGIEPYSLPGYIKDVLKRLARAKRKSLKGLER